MEIIDMRRQVLRDIFFLARSLLQDITWKSAALCYETIESDFVFTDASIRKEKTSSSSRKQRPLFVNVD